VGNARKRETRKREKSGNQRAQTLQRKNLRKKPKKNAPTETNLALEADIERHLRTQPGLHIARFCIIRAANKITFARTSIEEHH
jgi:hypothetical protein